MVENVSIRAPPPGAGRLRMNAFCAGGCSFNPRPASGGGATRRPEWLLTHRAMFQSAPRLRGRGDEQQRALAGRFALFQSAPRLRGRGDLFARSQLTERWTWVSIRAPPPGAGRQRRLYRLNDLGLFQSAPRLRGRGDACAVGKADGLWNVSIRAPPPGAGRRV